MFQRSTVMQEIENKESLKNFQMFNTVLRIIVLVCTCRPILSNVMRV